MMTFRENPGMVFLAGVTFLLIIVLCEPVVCRAAQQECEEKSWLDSDNKFLVDEALGAISRCMGAVAGKLKENIPQISKIADDAKGEVNYLIISWSRGDFVSPAYQESLVGDFRVLAAAAGETDAKRAFNLTKEVAADLKIKADHCRKSTSGLGDEVDVYIKTIRGDKEVSGLIVYYKLGIYEFSKKSMQLVRFDKLSSPTHNKLPASRYLFWAGKPGEPEPPRNMQEALIVGEGNTKIEFDLVLQ